MFKKGGVQEGAGNFEEEGQDKFHDLAMAVDEMDLAEFESYKKGAEEIYVGDIKEIVDDFGKGNAGNTQLEEVEVAMSQAEQAIEKGKRVVVVKDEEGGKHTYVIDEIGKN